MPAIAFRDEDEACGLVCIRSTPQRVLPRKLRVNSGQGHHFALTPSQEKSNRTSKFKATNVAFRTAEVEW